MQRLQNKSLLSEKGVVLHDEVHRLLSGGARYFSFGGAATVYVFSLLFHVTKYNCLGAVLKVSYELLLLCSDSISVK